MGTYAPIMKYEGRKNFETLMRVRIDHTTTHKRQPQLPVGVPLSPSPLAFFSLALFPFVEEVGGEVDFMV